MNKSIFMAIPPGAVIPGALPDFRIYVATPQGQYVLWAKEGNRVTPEQLAKLSESGTREVFVTLDEKFKYEQYLENHLGNILESPSATDGQKAEIFSKVSINVVRGAFETSYGAGKIDPAGLTKIPSPP